MQASTPSKLLIVLLHNFPLPLKTEEVHLPYGLHTTFQLPVRISSTKVQLNATTSHILNNNILLLQITHRDRCSLRKQHYMTANFIWRSNASPGLDISAFKSIEILIPYFWRTWMTHVKLVHEHLCSHIIVHLWVMNSMSSSTTASQSIAYWGHATSKTCTIFKTIFHNFREIISSI